MLSVEKRAKEYLAVLAKVDQAIELLKEARDLANRSSCRTPMGMDSWNVSTTHR
jgi:hypothetical protein